MAIELPIILIMSFHQIQFLCFLRGCFKFQLLCIHFSSMPRSLAGENEDHIYVLVAKLQMLKDLLVLSYN
jgi:hypothetical protein